MGPLLDDGRRRTSLRLFTAGFVVLAILSWYPFQFDPPRRVANDVTRLNDGTWRFGDPSMATSRTATAAVGELGDVDRLELRLVARSDDPLQRGPAHLLTLTDEHGAADLVVAQDGTSLVVRVRRPDADASRSSPLWAGAVFETGAWRQVRVRIDRSVEVFVDEELWSTAPGRALEGWGLGHVITLANEPDGGRPWAGDLRDVALRVDGRQVALLEDLDWHVPATVWDVPARLTENTYRPVSARSAALALHALVAAGLGFALLLGRRRPAIGSSVIWWAVAVLVMNGGKIVISGRHPSLLTALVQFGSGTAGMWLAFRVGARPRPDDPRRDPSPAGQAPGDVGG